MESPQILNLFFEAGKERPTEAVFMRNKKRF